MPGSDVLDDDVTLSWMLAAHWSRVITCPGYCPLIGHDVKVRDDNVTAPDLYCYNCVFDFVIIQRFLTLERGRGQFQKREYYERLKRDFIQG